MSILTSDKLARIGRRDYTIATCGVEGRKKSERDNCYLFVDFDTMIKMINHQETRCEKARNKRKEKLK